MLSGDGDEHMSNLSQVVTSALKGKESREIGGVMLEGKPSDDVTWTEPWTEGRRPGNVEYVSKIFLSKQLK